VNFEYNYYVLRDTKNNEEQKIYLPESIKVQLLEIPRVSEWVFSSRINAGGHVVDIRKPTDKLKRELGDEKFGIHYLRNVIVSAMAEQGFDSIHLSGALGHNDPNTIKKYLTMNYLKSSEMASGVIDGVVKK
jgi:integrase